jgi:hypothetical protein
MLDFHDICITITFSECVENSLGMEKIGKLNHSKGQQITPRYLRRLAAVLGEMDVVTELHNLTDLLPDDCQDAAGASSVLVIRNWVSNADNALAGRGHADRAFRELVDLDWDKKFLDVRTKRVKNKLKRHNLCFADTIQEPDYYAGKGRIVNFSALRHLSSIRESVATLLPFPGKIYAEGNKYYDTSKCNIGFHGDTERSFVVGLRLGVTMNLYYRWHYKSDVISKTLSIPLHHGDVYIMSYKTVGNDWKHSSICTLRHAAGLTIPK